MPAIHNLAVRQSSGITVSLDWSEDENDITVSVNCADTNFILHPPADKAMDCFNHPFAYADKVLASGSYR
jgi:hypothetical protein